MQNVFAFSLVCICQDPGLERNVVEKKWVGNLKQKGADQRRASTILAASNHLRPEAPSAGPLAEGTDSCREPWALHGA